MRRKLIKKSSKQRDFSADALQSVEGGLKPSSPPPTPPLNDDITVIRMRECVYKEWGSEERFQRGDYPLEWALVEYPSCPSF